MKIDLQNTHNIAKICIEICSKIHKNNLSLYENRYSKYT